MPGSAMSRSARGKIGGLTRAALAPDTRTLTQAARDGRWQKYRQQVLAVLPELAGDDAEIDRRAEMLRRAEMIRLSERAAARRRELAAIERDLDATSLDNAGSDGIDAG